MRSDFEDCGRERPESGLEALLVSHDALPFMDDSVPTMRSADHGRLEFSLVARCLSSTDALVTRMRSADHGRRRLAMSGLSDAFIDTFPFEDAGVLNSAKDCVGNVTGSCLRVSP